MDVDIAVDVQTLAEGNVHRTVDDQAFEVVQGVNLHGKARSRSNQVTQAGACGAEHVTHFVAAAGRDQLHMADRAQGVHRDVGRG